eukprot:3350405-Rhodomonas_salina.1
MVSQHEGALPFGTPQPTYLVDEEAALRTRLDPNLFDCESGYAWTCSLMHRFNVAKVRGPCAQLLAAEANACVRGCVLCWKERKAVVQDQAWNLSRGLTAPHVLGQGPFLSHFWIGPCGLSLLASPPSSLPRLPLPQLKPSVASPSPILCTPLCPRLGC